MDLPEEIMLMIFSRLSQLTILASVVPVCTSWKSLVDSDVSFWNELKILIDFGYFFNRRFFLKTAPKSSRSSGWIRVGEGDLKSVHKVKHVKFSNINRGSNPQLMVLEKVSNICDCIVSVELDNFHGTDCKHFLSHLGRRYEAIHELKFGCNYMYPYSELVNFKNLRAFKSEDPLFSGIDLNTLADNCVHLEKLWITSALEVKDEHLASFLDKMKDTIREIVIGFRVTDKSLCKIKECKNLETLSIGYASGLSDAVFQWTDELDKLRYLAIIRTDASADAVLNWLQSSKILSNLLVLHLQGNQEYPQLSREIQQRNNCKRTPKAKPVAAAAPISNLNGKAVRIPPLPEHCIVWELNLIFGCFT